MNHIYRLVWNRKLRVWQATSELASQSRGGRSPAGNCTAARTPRHALRVALAISLSALSTAVQAVCTVSGASVTCTGPADPASPGFSSGANNLAVTVAPGATLGVPVPNGGTAMALTGTNVTLTNAGRIDAKLLGDPIVLSSGLIVGNASASTARVSNMASGTIAGTVGLVGSALPDLDGMALAVQNGAGGVSHLSNAGMIRSQPLAGLLMAGADMPVIAAHGGGQVNFVNEPTGTITGRIAFEASGTPGAGNSFANAGTIVGGVSLGQGGSANTFTAVSGSVITRGTGSAIADLTVTGTPNLRFAPPGKVDGGAGGGNTLVLQNVLPSVGTGSGASGAVTAVSGDTYINFRNVRINSGTWNLDGSSLVGAGGGSIELNGGLANLANIGVFGANVINAQGGSISAGAAGLTFGNTIVLGAGGLTTTGANSFSLAGLLLGPGSLNVAGPGTVSLRGISNYMGGTTIGSFASLTGDNDSLQGNIVNQGLLTFSQGTNGAYAGAISGGGSLRKEGAGTLTLTGQSTYTGSTTISAGTLAVGATGRLPVGAVDLLPGTTLDLSSAGNQALSTLAGAGSVLLNANTLTVNGSASGMFDGVISGAGALMKTGTGTLTLTGANTFTGGVTVNGGTLALAPGGGLRTDSAVTVNTSATLDLSSGGSRTLGTLDGNGGEVQIGPNTLTLGAGTYAGVISGAGGVTKSGAGALALNGANTYTGVTRVNGGALWIGADASQATARVNGNINVANTAALGGFGQVNGDVIVQTGGRLAPGNPGGVFTVNGDLTLAQGSLAEFNLGASGASHSVTVNGNLQLNGALFNMQDAGGFGVGVYRLFDYTGTLTLSDGGLLAPSLGLGIQINSSSRLISLISTVGAELNFWNANRLASPTRMGGGSGVWSSAAPNWTDATGSVTALRQPADAFVIFGGDPGIVEVDTLGGTSPVAAQGIQFASDGYHLTRDALALTGTSPGAPGEVRVGDGSAASAAWTAIIDNVLTGNGIDKTGLGTLVLNGANTYTQATRLTRGTLSVSGDANLGAASASLDFQGGTLRVTGTAYQSTARSISLGAAGGGFDIAAAANTFTVAQPLAGNGGLAKLGAGTLVLTGSNTYLGGTSVQAGTLQVGDGATSGSIAGNVDIASGGTLSFNRGDRVLFGGNVSGAGELRHAGTGALVLTGQNTYTGNTTIQSGTLQVGDGGTAGALAGNVVNNGSLVFNRSDDSVYAGALSGAGAMTKLGAGALALTGDSSAYTGATQLSGGALQVDGKLGGEVVAAAGTTLAGAGTLHTVTVASGALLSPGNAAAPFGRMNLLGDLNFKPGSAYRVATAADGQHSSVHVAGTANLAGSVVQLAQNGNYAPSTTYAILTAGNGVQGRFDAVSSNLAFLTPSLSYGSNKVDLVVNLKDVPGDNGGGTRPIEFADAAFTGNQRAVARALQSLPTNSALYRHVLNLPNDAPAAAFNALSGESHASTVSALQGVASTFTQAPMTRLRANLNAGWMPGAPTAQLGLGDAAALPQAAAQPLWTQVFGNWTTLGGDGNAAKTTQSDAGVTIGGDQSVGGGWRLGGAFGYTNSRSRTGDRASSSDADSYSVTVYGGKAFEAGAGKINLSLGAAYTWHDLETQRNTAAAGLDQTLKASYGASTGQVFTELGYAVPLNERVTLEPFIGANYSDLRTRGFSESGGDAALRGESGSNSVTTTTLGLHALTTFESAGARGHVHGTLGWRHAFGDLNPASTLSFVQGSDSFTATGAPVARDAVVVELGVGMEVSKRTTVGLVYGGQFGEGNRQNSGTLDVRYRF
ncbi:DUF6850 family outer membrane beta-barrel protein [Achromobacter sp. NPDC058515]|uniref:DUF6850 family outer membrane beta-barrel protein n=1 Tax=Achromobacter sp. NPDC058515 TaxID=3346533 RepID=UPI00365E4506